MSTLRFHGAAREVTGSMHLIEVNGRTVALDCGLFQGRRAEATNKNKTFPIDPKQLDAVILSHAHIDHSGKLPRLVKEGFTGPIYATPATCDLAGVMLADAAHIQEEDAGYLNRKQIKAWERNGRKGNPPPEIQPLYNADDAARTATLLQPHRLGNPFEVVPGLRATFHEAGHMLGSAGVLLEITERKGKTLRVTFTGDLGRRHLPILRDPAPLPACDYLICESTYGARMTDEPTDMTARFGEVLRETFARGGKVVIPAFAVGRTQMLVYAFNQLYRRGELPPGTTLVVDSPLAYRATEIYRRHPETYDAEATAFNGHGDMLSAPVIEYTENVEESKALNERKGPLVIISASGMCEAGRILHHLKNNIEDRRNTILIVGFQAVHTLGRRLIEKRPVVRIYGEEYQVRAEVKVLNGFSSHANAAELLKAVRPVAKGCKTAFLVHGEPDQAEALAEGMRKNGFARVRIPAPGESFRLE